MQVYDSSELGSQFMRAYRIDTVTELPIILILDPITGAKQRQLLGFIEPQRSVTAVSPIVAFLLILSVFSIIKNLIFFIFCFVCMACMHEPSVMAESKQR